MKDTVNYIHIIRILQRDRFMLYKIMKNAAIFCFALVLASCGGNAEPRKIQQLHGSDKLLYEEALSDIGENNQAAIDKLNVLELNYPKSAKLPEAMALKLYALYSAEKYDDAILQADKFISLYPKHTSTPYAYYIKGLASQKKMMDSQRDQSITENAINAFQDLERNFPDSEYVQASRTMSDQAQNMLAIKQIEIGRFYAARGQHSAAAERFQNVLRNYAHTHAAPEAMYRMIEVHISLSSPENANRYCQMLLERHPQSVWAEKAVKIQKNNTQSIKNKTKYPTKSLIIQEDVGLYNTN